MPAAPDCGPFRLSVYLSLMLAVFGLRILALPAYPVPVPTVTDEYAYLYAATTFAEGRLTNPPLPWPEFFEAQHILSTPSSMSKYQPGTALLMAASKHITGDFYWGVVASVALLVSGLYWALCAWCRGSTAFAISLIFLLLFRAPHYWINSYWGGALPMFSCVLMLGAYRRIAHDHLKKNWWWFAIGCGIGFLTRPLESGLAAVVFLTALVRRHWRSGILPMFTILFPLFCAQGWYNQRVTGSVWSLPYSAHSKIHMASPMLVGQSAHPERLSSNPVIREWQDYELDYYHSAFATPWLHAIIRTPNILSEFFFLKRFAWQQNLHSLCMQALTLLNILLPLCFIRHMWLRRQHYVIGAGMLASLGLASMMLPMFPHYLVAYLGFYLIGTVLLMQDWIQHTRHPLTCRQIGALLLTALLLFASLPMLSPKDPKAAKYWFTIMNPRPREAIRIGLEATQREHLIFVGTGEGFFQASWVQNGPNLADAKILWARDISPEANQKLIDASPNRQLWYVEPVEDGKLRPYEP